MSSIIFLFTSSSSGLEATAKGIQDIAICHSTKHDQQEKHIRRHEAGLHFASSPGFPDLVKDEESSSCPNLGIGLVLHRLNTGFAARITTLSAYSETNRTFLSQLLPFAPKEKHTAEQKIQISPDSMVGDSTKIEERTTIKKCVIGKHCTIGKMVRLVGCVVLDHCVIGDGSKLDGCLLGQSTKVGAKAELVRCATQAGFEVSPGDSFKNEKLQLSDWTATPESSDQGDSEDDAGERDGGTGHVV
jgi:translation initiation factor eIF-2B subunit gamma